VNTKKRAVLPDWSRAIEERVNLLLVTFLLIIIGILLLALPLVERGIKATSVFQVLGGGVLGAGLSALVATVTAREAVRQQYAKEANLVRKREYYAPLHAELKYLREQLTKSLDGSNPYPLEVTASPNPHVMIALDSIAIPLVQWSQYRQDYRADEFTEKAKVLFDLVQQGAETYTQARTAAEEYTHSLLIPYVDQAVARLRKSPEYIAWQQDEAARRTSGQSWVSPGERKWYGAVEHAISLVENDITANLSSMKTPGAALTEWWLTSQNAPNGPRLAVLWLLAGKVELAVAYVQSGYHTELQNPPPPLEWLRAIFEAAWPELDTSPAYAKAREALQDLLSRTQAAEQLLRDGLQRIQDLYEGGAPLV